MGWKNRFYAKSAEMDNGEKTLKYLSKFLQILLFFRSCLHDPCSSLLIWELCFKKKKTMQQPRGKIAHSTIVLKHLTPTKEEFICTDIAILCWSHILILI